MSFSVEASLGHLASVELGVVQLKTPQPRLDPRKSEWHVGQSRPVNGKVYKRRVRALDKTKT